MKKDSLPVAGEKFAKCGHPKNLAYTATQGKFKYKACAICICAAQRRRYAARKLKRALEPEKKGRI